MYQYSSNEDTKAIYQLTMDSNYMTNRPSSRPQPSTQTTVTSRPSKYDVSFFNFLKSLPDAVLTLIWARRTEWTTTERRVPNFEDTGLKNLFIPRGLASTASSQHAPGKEVPKRGSDRGFW